MKVLIIEDEAPAFRRLQKLLETIDSEIEICEVIDGVVDAVDWMKNNEMPDLIFMDIQLSDGISFDIFDQVKIDKPVIFTTAFDEYMLRAFKVSSIDYLLKPINQDDLARSLEKYSSLKSQFSENSQETIKGLLKNIRLDDRKFKTRYLVKMGTKMFSIDVRDIACFEAKEGLVHLHTNKGKKYLIDYPLDEIIDELDPNQFFRVNRQYILCISTIEAAHKLGKGKLLLDTNFTHIDQIIVSSEKGTNFKEWLG